MHMLRFEQTLTPAVCTYLATRTNETALLGAFDRFMGGKPYLTGWQTWWLQQPLARFGHFSSGKSGDRRIAWVTEAFADASRSPVLRSHAAMALAKHNATSADDLLAFYDRSSPVVRPVLVAAVGLLGPNSRQQQAVVGDSLLHKWVFDWAVNYA